MHIVENRRILCDHLSLIGNIRIIGVPHANFVFCQLLKGDIHALQKWLFSEHKILIKVFEKKAVIKGSNYFRVGVRTRALNEQLTSALERYCSAVKCDENDVPELTDYRHNDIPPR